MLHVILSSGGETAVDMSNVVKEGLTGISNQMSGVITAVVPIALGIVGAVMVVVFGVRIFKKLTGGSSGG